MGRNSDKSPLLQNDQKKGITTKSKKPNRDDPTQNSMVRRWDGREILDA
jgi:hypothetical protein